MDVLAELRSSISRTRDVPVDSIHANATHLPVARQKPSGAKAAFRLEPATPGAGPAGQHPGRAGRGERDQPQLCPVRCRPRLHGGLCPWRLGHRRCGFVAAS
jgi:hypothetical protein